MEEKSLKTSPWQRVIIIVVALLLLGSTILAYMFIVMNNGSSSQSSEEKISELSAEYDAKTAELNEAAQPFSDKYFSEMEGYKKSRVKSYNSATANSEKLKIEDLKEGTGRQLEEGDTDYSAYYIGWCADGSIFDSSFSYASDDTEKETPTGLNAPLIATSSLIEGWNQGVVGMKLGGVRQLTIPSELAYGETTEGNHICGASNSPLKFVVMTLETDDNLKQLNDELTNIRYQLYTALAGGSAA